MSSTAVLEPPAEGAKAKDAIPRDRPVDDAVMEMAKARMLPRPPGSKLSYDEMQAYFGLLTEEMWHHVIVYVYRNHPRIIRKLINPQNTAYIDCLGHPLDMDYMIEHHGGGRYHLMVVDTESKGAANKLFTCDFDVDANKYPPKLTYEELDINHKENMAYVNALQHKGILDSRGQVMQNQPNGGSSESTKWALDFAREVIAEKEQSNKEKQSAAEQQGFSKTMGEIVIENMKQNDPNRNAAPLLGIVEKVLAAKPADGNSQIFEKVIAVITTANQQALQMTTENNKTVLAMFQQLSEARREPAPNPQIEQFRELMTVAKEFASMSGGGGHRSGWDIGLDYAEKLIVPAVQTIGNLIALNRTGRPIPGVTPGATAAPAAPAAFDPYRDPAAMRAHSRALAEQPAPAPAAANGAPQPPAMPAQNEITVLAQTYGYLVVNHLNAGTPGHEFGDLFSGMFGMGMHAQVCAHGEPVLLEAMMSVPEIAMFGEPRLKKFVHEFVNFQEILEQDNEDEEDQPEIPSARDRMPAAAAGQEATR